MKKQYLKLPGLNIQAISILSDLNINIQAILSDFNIQPILSDLNIPVGISGYFRMEAAAK